MYIFARHIYWTSDRRRGMLYLHAAVIKKCGGLKCVLIFSEPWWKAKHIYSSTVLKCTFEVLVSIFFS